MKIVFLSTRIAGNDGVSLEAVRWKEILERMGHKVTFMAGELDRRGILIPELHFQREEVVNLHDKVTYEKKNYRKVEREIYEIAGKIEGVLREVFNNGNRPDLLIVANIFSLPVHFPLAVALSRIEEELKIPIICRHHDFWWERERYLRSSMFTFFEKYFPPNIPNMKHVVINTIAQRELKKRFGYKSVVIPDTFDFDSELGKIDSFSGHFRKDFGIKKDDVVFLQATRIVPRKRVELSINLVKKLKNPKFVLVIAGHAGDEGLEYQTKIKKIAGKSGIKAFFVGDYVNARRKIRGGRRIYTLWDAFVNSDIITYPTAQEGFGNQFIEATFFKKPIVITPYTVYKKDIKPLGYKVIEMNKNISDNVIYKIKNLLEDSNRLQKMVDRNFLISKKYFSYEAVEEKLKKLLS
jgi:glycosyltransferase involved in cell wall biosynthesis